jgi:hypothetical protein
MHSMFLRCDETDAHSETDNGSAYFVSIVYKYSLVSCTYSSVTQLMQLE